MISKKEEILALKRQQANVTKQEKLNRKQYFELQIKAAEDERKAKVTRLEEMEQELRLMRKSQSPRSNKFTTPSETGDLYLKHLKDLQKKAKELLLRDPYATPRQKLDHTLNKESIEQNIQNQTPVRIPVLIPHSIVQRTLKIQPPSIQKQLKNGEIGTIYLLSESDSAYNPLVKAEISVNRKDLGNQKSFVGEIKYEDERKWKSISPRKKHIEDLDLTKYESINLGHMTPKMRVERYNYRDYSLSDLNYNPIRNWVGTRMKMYSDLVKSSFKPITSVRKQLELDLMKEKAKKTKPVSFNKLKLNL
ncbi:hypothetical protein SteCoe_2796 [Stentor coeruleus]|uniref:Uncharacterized protein n=1 Tax=Stentor coeruleus TaxID=5963 RepID=A0A1R2CYV0_9CILI|nr:hypothetical protein SteCoe_2796 [Stentor coeruleus]